MEKRTNMRRVFLLQLLWVICLASVFGVSKKVLAAQDEIEIHFADSTGKIYGSLSTKVLKQGESMILPEIPSAGGVDGTGAWKLEKTKIANTMSFSAKASVSYDTLKRWPEYIKDGQMTLYASSVCTLDFYNNSGSKYYSEKRIQAFEGTKVRLPGSLDGNSLNKGWSRYKNGTGVWAKLNSVYTVTESLKLYQVYYIKVTFLDIDGKSGTAYKALEKVVRRNSTIKMPAVPAKTNYSALGWSGTKNSTTARYKAGASVKVTKNYTFYAARQYLSCKVYFYTNTGRTTTDTKKLNQSIKKNTVLKLPAVPEVTGYVGLGWTTTKKGTTVTHKADASVKITKTTKFYAVYRKAEKYTIKFYRGDGKTNSAYTALKKTVYEGQKLKMPEVPERTGYENVGWYRVIDGKKYLYKTGGTITVRANLVFYAYQKEQKLVTLCRNDGTVYSKIYLTTGNTYELPALENGSDTTFMGWSTQKGKVVPGAGDYFEAGEKLTITSHMKLYEVIANRSQEANLQGFQLAKLDKQKYQKAIWVGDSRTHRMEITLKYYNAVASLKDVTFVSKSGQGLTWLKEEGYEKILSAVGEGSKAGEPKTAVLFNLGVNDLSDYNSYISYMNTIGNELRSKGCELFFISVNPINSRQIKYFEEIYAHPLKTRTEQEVRNFNNALFFGLSGYTIIDSYNWLMQTGYGTDNGANGQNIGQDDGLHYTVKTYKRIFDYCLRAVNQA